MSNDLTRTNAAIIRRETHSSRAAITSVVILLVVAGIGYLCAEIIAAMSGKHLLVPASQLWHYALVGTQQVQILAPVGAITLLVGVFLLVKAFAPGRLSRHAIRDERIAMVMDDSVIAAGTSAAMRRGCGLDSSQVSTSVGARNLDVHITPTSGAELDQAQIAASLEKVVDSYHLEPQVKTRVNLAKEGKVAQ
ncbi:MAG: DUF6286 domain-containing protein [Actinomycetaceae bacterium]|nr:DUF6286 domain-containing protein [Actinomycetaceae bacterium]